MRQTVLGHLFNFNDTKRSNIDQILQHKTGLLSYLTAEQDWHFLSWKFLTHWQDKRTKVNIFYWNHTDGMDVVVVSH